MTAFCGLTDGPEVSDDEVTVGERSDEVGDGEDAIVDPPMVDLVLFCNRQVVSCKGASGFTTNENDAAVQSTSSRHQPKHS